MAISTRKEGAVGQSDYALPAYWPRFRERVFTFLNMAYQRLNAAEFKETHEPDISGELARVLDEIIDDSSSPSLVRTLTVHDDPAIHSADRRGKQRRRSDLRIDWVCDKRPRPRYTFEAKRLCRRTNMGEQKYLGEDGLGMFTKGIYAQNEFEAGMLGYVQDGSITDWASKIEKRLAKDDTLIEGGHWTRRSVISELESYHSLHARSTIGTPIAIYHIFLLFQ